MTYKIDADIITGTWVGGADDGSGLRTMIYNYGVTFEKDGRGLSFSWSAERKQYEETKDRLEWKLSENRLIQIRYLNDDGKPSDWEILEIEISDFIGAYSSNHYKIVDKGKDTFWSFPEPLYKSKYIPNEKGIFRRAWEKLKNRIKTK